MLTQKREKNKNSALAELLKTNKRSIKTVMTIVLILLSGLFMYSAWDKYEKSASAEAITLAKSLESVLPVCNIMELTGNETDINTKSYTYLKHSLMRLVNTASRIRFAYLMAERDGKLIVLIDSEAPESNDYSPPGQVYEEANEIYFKPFNTGEIILTEPKTDRWGTWISALVPVYDPSEGKIIAVFGIDYSASEWRRRIIWQMLPSAMIIISFLLLCLALAKSHSQGSLLKKLSEKLTYNETLYRSVFEQAPVGIAIVDDKNFIKESIFGNMNINPMFEKIIGKNSDELISITWPEIIHPQDLQADLELYKKFKSGEIESYSMEKRFLRSDGSSVWTNMKVSHLSGLSDISSMHLCLLEDISAQKEIEESLRESERSKTVLLSHLPGLAYRCYYDRDWTMQFVSDGCFKLTGYKPESLLYNKELSYNDMIAPEYREAIWKEWERIISKRETFRFEYEIITAEGKRKWVLEMGEGIYNEDGIVTALEGIVIDISDRKQIEDYLIYSSEHDRWTGLYNRSYLERLLRKDAISDTEQKRAAISVNLNAAQALTILYGFHYTQDILKNIVDSLIELCNDERLLFNTYENRFVFYIKNYKNRKDLSEFCEAIINKLKPILGAERIGAGLGIIEIDENNKFDEDLLLKKLLIASEKALHIYEGDYGFWFYDDSMEEQIKRESDIKHELSKIAADINDKALFLQYQPILSLKSNKICGFEALARLKSDALGSVLPVEFIPIAEKTKLIIPIGIKLQIMAFQFMKELKDKGYDDIILSVNISVNQLLHAGFVEKLMELIRETQISPEDISLEITESVFSSNYQEINIILGELLEAGFHIAIDDFGTGYSSFARERDLNINCLKIDKYFIDKLLYLRPEEEITSDIISMAHKLGHCVIAEGVEHIEQMQYLKDSGCDKIQGYFVGKPMDKEVVFDYLSEYNEER
jgi:PAS domain S-box-containing protein